MAEAPRRPRQPSLEPWQDPGAEPFLRVEGVTRAFGSLYAVDDVSLSIYQGEFFSLLGGSGCGKSTLLRMLAGFERCDEGRIFMDGVDMSGVAPYERPVNMMFQSYALFPHMSVEQNIMFGLRQDGLAREEIRRRTAEMLELLHIGPLARRKPEQLSGGQRQRVALARCLAKRPKLLLLDEPLGALDKKLREHTQFELVNLQEQVGITFVMVTHDQEEAMTMSTRIAVMRDGRIMQVGTPAGIYEFPSSRYVADFIGSVNLFEGKVVENLAEQVRVRAPALDLDLLVSHPQPLPVGTEVAVALRPEKVRISKQPLAKAPYNSVSGTIAEIAYLGDVSIYHVETISGPVVEATAANVLPSTEQPFTWDDRVHLWWTPNCGVVLLE